jgi:hypothetical protein
MSPVTSVWKESASQQDISSCFFWTAYSFRPGDGGDTFLQNVCSYQSHKMSSKKKAFFIFSAAKTSALTISALLMKSLWISTNN